MNNMKLNNMPKLQLSTLLKRRKMTLKMMLDELGITTYPALCNQCSRMGIVAPDEAEFNRVQPARNVNDPDEGVIIVEPMRVVAESSGRYIPEEELNQYSLTDIDVYNSSSMPTEPSLKKRNRRKVEA